MLKWKRDEMDFLVSVSNDGNGNYLYRIPKSVLKLLDNLILIKSAIHDENISIIKRE